MGRFVASIFVGLAGSLAGASAFADQIQLKGGGSIEGVVIEDGDDVVIQMDMGTVTLPRAEIALVVPAASALDELKTRLDAVGDTDARGLFAVARWAATRGLLARARAIARQVIARQPDHAQARAMLGHEKIDGRWLSPAEVMRHRGYVRRGAGWITREQAEAQAQVREAARARDKAADQEARLLQLEREVAAAKAAAEAARAAAQAPEVFLRPWPYGFAPQTAIAPGGARLGGFGGLQPGLTFGMSLQSGFGSRAWINVNGAAAPARTFR